MVVTKDILYKRAKRHLKLFKKSTKENVGADEMDLFLLTIAVLSYFDQKDTSEFNYGVDND